MLPRSYGPIAEIRHASASGVALTVGAVFGGAAPLVNYFTVHLGELVVWNDAEKRLIVNLESPLWFMVAGSFVLSSKSVFRWAYKTFGDWASALGLVAMLEGTLVFAPHWAMGITALVFLVGLNAAAYGSVLGQRDEEDKAWDAQRKAELSPAVSLSQPEERKPTEALPAAEALPAPSSSLALPATSSPAPVSVGDDLLDRAIEVVRGLSDVSIEQIRQGLKCRQPLAAEAALRLAQAGVLGKPDPSNRGRRPVLIQTDGVANA